VAESKALQKRFAEGAEHALRTRPTYEGAHTDEQMTRLRQRVGEFVRDLDMLRLAAKGRPSNPTTSGECSGPCRTSPRVPVVEEVRAARLPWLFSAYTTFGVRQLWARQVTHLDCGADGGAHWAAGIDCPDREVVGSEFARRGQATEAEGALEAACIARFGTLQPHSPTPPMHAGAGRDDRGPLSQLAGGACLAASLPDLPRGTAHSATIHRPGNPERPHQALGFLSPQQCRAQQRQRVACPRGGTTPPPSS